MEQGMLVVNMKYNNVTFTDKMLVLATPMLVYIVLSNIMLDESGFSYYVWNNQFNVLSNSFIMKQKTIDQYMQLWPSIINECKKLN